ncbi:MAG: hypothetical protein ABSH22_22705 [Tepidisphaeraceae bacterium]
MATSTRSAWAACAAIVVALMIWPADVPWGGDDVVLISRALLANHEHRLIDVGLSGTFHLPYGPLPEQIYQCLLAMTHNPLLLASLHAGLLAGATAAGLLWLTRTLQWSPWLAVMGMLSPFFWFYTRLIWDNTFAIPVGTVFLAAYAAYIRRPSRAPFLAAVACALMLPLIHPMTIPLVAAVAAHAGFRCREGFRRWWPGVAALLLLAAISGGRYVVQCAEHRSYGPLAAADWYQKFRLSCAGGMAFPLQAGQLFSAYSYFDDRYAQIWPASTLRWRICSDFSAAAFGLAWIGMAMSLTRVRAGWRGSDAASALAAISIVALGLQGVMDAALRIAPFPHYFCGTWIACWICLCMGVRRLGRLGTGVGITYAASLIVSSGVVGLSVHRYGGGRDWYGFSLGSQLTAAQELSKFKDSHAQTDVRQLAENPYSLALLRRLIARPAERFSDGHLMVRWSDPDSPEMRLEVSEQPGPIPAGAVQIPTAILP